jgi:hypothetical protein
LPQWDDTVAAPLAPVSPAPLLKKKKPPPKKKINRQLTPAKLGFAWKKIRRVVQEMSKQHGYGSCQLEESRIEFQSEANTPAITLVHENSRIFASICTKQWTIRIVRIKTTGSAYEFRRQRYSATRLIAEMLRQAEIVAESRRPKPSVVLQQRRQLYIRQLTCGLNRYQKTLAKLSGAREWPVELSSEQRLQFEQLTAHRETVLAELRALNVEPRDSDRDSLSQHE